MRFQKACFAGVAAVFLLTSCSDDEPTGPLRDPGSFDIPFDFTLAEAPGRVSPGDTLNILASPFLNETVVFPSSTTPLVILGNKTASISSLGGGALIRFSTPRDGTVLKDLNFSGGDPALDVDGSGGVVVDGCTFSGGQVQVMGSGIGLNLEVTGTLLRNASGNAIEVEARASLTAFGNSIVRAGANGIEIRTEASALVNNCIIWEAAGFGVQCSGGGTLSGSSGCNDNFANVMGGYDGCTPPSGDFSLDPRFCDPDNGDYTIAATSPCAPLNSGGCDLIGAYLPNCPN